MTDRLTALEDRVAALEQALAELRAAVHTLTPEPVDPNDPFAGNPRFRKKPPPEVLEAHNARIDKLLGIENVPPVGVEKLREMMIADGIDPNDNEFSRGIIEMREE